MRNILIGNILRIRGIVVGIYRALINGSLQAIQNGMCKAKLNRRSDDLTRRTWDVSIDFNLSFTRPHRPALSALT